MAESYHEAQVYDKKSSLLQTPDGIKLMNLVNIAEDSKVLDLGCGTGNLTVELAKRVGSKGQVVGIDPDTERLLQASENNVRDNIVYLEAHGENFPEDQYDLVFSNYVLHWIENKDAVFKKVYNNLRPGGVFMFIAVQWNPQIFDTISDLMGEGKSEEINSGLNFEPAEIYENLAKDNGFTVTLLDRTPSLQTFPSIESVIDLWFAITHGKFDPALVDDEIMENFVQQYGGQPVDVETPIVRLILKK